MPLGDIAKSLREWIAANPSATIDVIQVVDFYPGIIVDDALERLAINDPGTSDNFKERTAA